MRDVCLCGARLDRGVVQIKTSTKDANERKPIKGRVYIPRTHNLCFSAALCITSLLRREEGVLTIEKRNIERRMRKNAVHASHTTCTLVLQKKKQEDIPNEEVTYPCDSLPMLSQNERRVETCELDGKRKKEEKIEYPGDGMGSAWCEWQDLMSRADMKTISARHSSRQSNPLGVGMKRRV
jgi:hypothetical protein